MKVFTGRYFEGRTLQFLAFGSLFVPSQTNDVFFFQFENFVLRPWTLIKKCQINFFFQMN